MVLDSLTGIHSSDMTNGGFLKWGIPNSWMVYKGKSHKMDYEQGCPPHGLGNLHMVTSNYPYDIDIYYHYLSL